MATAPYSRGAHRVELASEDEDVLLHLRRRAQTVCAMAAGPPLDTVQALPGRASHPPLDRRATDPELPATARMEPPAWTAATMALRRASRPFFRHVITSQCQGSPDYTWHRSGGTWPALSCDIWPISLQQSAVSDRSPDRLIANCPAPSHLPPLPLPAASCSCLLLSAPPRVHRSARTFCGASLCEANPLRVCQPRVTVRPAFAIART